MGRPRIIITALAIGLFAAPALAQSPPADQAAALAAVDAAFAAEAAARPIGSLTVGVVDHGKLIWTKSYGFADMESHVPATRETVYRIGSITKPFTAVALLQLAAKGKVSLDDPAVKYVPELNTVRNFGDAAQSVTLLSLATHRAGLAREPDNLRYLVGPIDTWEATAREALGHTSEAFKPNDEANYSNIGYSALGLALETASGMPYTDLVERNVVKPLGMTSTGFRPSADMRARLAKGYGVARGGADPSASQAELVTGRGYKIPNGGLFTTVDDLAKFLAFEMGYGPEKVLSRATWKANLDRSYPMRGGGRYGVGFTITPVGDKSLVGHDGAVAGYSASAVFDPASQVGLVCLRSADYGCEGIYTLKAMVALAPAWDPQARLAQAAQDGLARRVTEQKPYPGGEAVLRRVSGALQRGEPDYSKIAPPLAGAVREQLPATQARLAKLGALQAVTFRGVGPGGADIYEADFAGGKLEFRMGLGADGSLEGFSLRSLS